MTIQEYVERGREAVEAIKDYDQAQTDKLVYEAAKVIYQHAAELAREAVDETGLGYYEDKICKNTDTPAAFWAAGGLPSSSPASCTSPAAKAKAVTT